MSGKCSFYYGYTVLLQLPERTKTQTGEPKEILDVFHIDDAGMCSIIFGLDFFFP